VPRYPPNLKRESLADYICRCPQRVVLHAPGKAKRHAKVRRKKAPTIMHAAVKAPKHEAAAKTAQEPIPERASPPKVKLPAVQAPAPKVAAAPPAPPPAPAKGATSPPPPSAPTATRWSTPNTVKPAPPQQALTPPPPAKPLEKVEAQPSPPAAAPATAKPVDITKSATEVAALRSPAAKPGPETIIVSYAAGGSAVPADSLASIKEASDRLAANPALRVRLFSYATDAEKNVSRARRLSLERAVAVRKVLIDNGLDSTRIEVRALGEQNPGGEPNRVDIVLVARR
jgi:outer membrane protein OmpA-like peptidoglycan-associated protein